jgi:oxygen-independent coproporphyrinogen-3 oxidase
LYFDLLPGTPNIRELHLGGGASTFFSVKNLKKSIDRILKTATVSGEYEFSYEGHPNNTSKEQLQALYDLGVRRNSFGFKIMILKWIN